jgi:hypothetical protein
MRYRWSSRASFEPFREIFWREDCGAISLGLSNDNTLTAHPIRTGSGCVAITPPRGEPACLKGIHPANPRRPVQDPTPIERPSGIGRSMARAGDTFSPDRVAHVPVNTELALASPSTKLSGIPFWRTAVESNSKLLSIQVGRAASPAPRPEGPPCGNRASGRAAAHALGPMRGVCSPLRRTAQTDFAGGIPFRREQITTDNAASVAISIPAYCKRSATF